MSLRLSLALHIDSRSLLKGPQHSALGVTALVVLNENINSS